MFALWRRHGTDFLFAGQKVVNLVSVSENMCMPAARRTAEPRIEPQTPTRDLILDEAERLIAHRGVNGFTLKDITDPLGVQVPSIYKHYSSRDDVLVALSRRFVERLSQLFYYPPEALAQPSTTLREVIVEFARFHITHPAYVRLQLVDFATPEGGVEYVRLAAGGPFRSNLSEGPLAIVHRRMRKLLLAGQKAGEFRKVSAVDFFCVVKSSILLRLVFPDDMLVVSNHSPSVMRSLENDLWDIAYRYVTAGPLR